MIGNQLPMQPEVWLLMKKIFEYIYGLDIVLETDHKPIVALSNKSLNDISPRIQRLMLRLQKHILVSN